MPANIAEGHGRDTRGEYIQFLRVAQGSLKEVETHLLLAEKVDISTAGLVDPVLKLCDDLGKC